MEGGQDIINLPESADINTLSTKKMDYAEALVSRFVTGELRAKDARVLASSIRDHTAMGQASLAVTQRLFEQTEQFLEDERIEAPDYLRSLKSVAELLNANSKVASSNQKDDAQTKKIHLDTVAKLMKESKAMKQVSQNIAKKNIPQPVELKK